VKNALKNTLKRFFFHFCFKDSQNAVNNAKKNFKFDDLDVEIDLKIGFIKTDRNLFNLNKYSEIFNFLFSLICLYLPT